MNGAIRCASLSGALERATLPDCDEQHSSQSGPMNDYVPSDSPCPARPDKHAPPCISFPHRTILLHRRLFFLVLGSSYQRGGLGSSTVAHESSQTAEGPPGSVGAIDRTDCRGSLSQRGIDADVKLPIWFPHPPFSMMIGSSVLIVQYYHPLCCFMY
jgi:hypothetical protein